jgi:hypothetical protein
MFASNSCRGPRICYDSIFVAAAKRARTPLIRLENSAEVVTERIGFDRRESLQDGIDLEFNRMTLKVEAGRSQRRKYRTVPLSRQLFCSLHRPLNAAAYQMLLGFVPNPRPVLLASSMESSILSDALLAEAASDFCPDEWGHIR